MPSHRLTIELSQAAYDKLQQMVVAGRFPSEQDAIERALAESVGEQPTELPSGQAGLEAWLRDVVVPADEEYLADPSTGCTLDDFEQRFRAKYPLKKTA